MQADYAAFLKGKRALAQPCGFSISESRISGKLFPFQRDVTRFDLERGKSGNFLNTGLGKGPIQMEWCSHVSERAQGDTLIAAPLAVAQQFKRESLRFGYDLTLCKSQTDVRSGINVTNYDRLDLFDLNHFKGVALDESSCIKDWTSKTSQKLIAGLAATPYKLCSSATPSPNDHAELGTHSELLDVMRRPQMLAMFFEHDGGETSKWTLKGHGKKPFFRFVASWGVCVKRPSDLGYPDEGFDLPPLHMHEHIVPVDQSQASEGMLFRSPDMSATGLHKEMRLTAKERARKVAEIVFGGGWSDKPCGSQSTPTVVDARGNPIQSMLRAPSPEKPVARRRKTKPTCDNTTPITAQSGISALPKNESGPIALEESVTPAIQDIGSSALGTYANGNPTTRKNASANGSVNSGSLQKSIDHSSPVKEDAAQSASDPTTDTQKRNQSDCTLITAIEQGPSGDSCAVVATSDSEALGTARIRYVEPSTISSIPQWIVWCNTDYEQDPLEQMFGDLCISIRGRHSPEEKETKIMRWLNNERPILLTKPSVAGFGLNFQQCHNMVFMGLSYSFEALFQAIRRCWRYGQTRPVNAHIVIAETEGPVLQAIKVKEKQYEELQSEMNEAMREEQLLARRVITRYDHAKIMSLPRWLHTAERYRND